MASLAQHLLPPQPAAPSDRQRLFLLVFTGILIDLVVLGLFAEYSDHVYVDSFTTALFASIVLQLLIKLTIVAEHRILARFKDKSGAGWKIAKFLVAWLILFGSKFVILEVLSVIFARDVHFEGVMHGVLWLVIVVASMVTAEELAARLYRSLA
ncbi:MULTISPECIES: hypothetical protein [Sphingomonadales]|uniref:Uncharacterized protein n=1 Tax=Rhizorhabdus wittichii (strain DSM 6014 / CCUG 31198 / JCM 15750 / NBRC 105917 / EY 4224 / RW1) TaxID=392499 RepID=A0A9J9H8V5_RHIWR|nr:hypothetical protein Swit_0695 [Rhizorhabdus wittichii RW1]ARR56159.1 hypothetical protein HY78_23220 [Rhizorhabdus wittichii DC-6]